MTFLSAIAATACVRRSRSALEASRVLAASSQILSSNPTLSPPPKTTDFTPIVQALKAANADIVLICSYPVDSVGIVEAANEIGLNPKLFGGAMVGLQALVFKDKLKTKLNGIVNYETWVPDKKQMYEGTEAFFKEYQEKAKAAAQDVPQRLTALEADLEAAQIAQRRATYWYQYGRMLGFVLLAFGSLGYLNPRQPLIRRFANRRTMSRICSCRPKISCATRIIGKSPPVRGRAI